MGPTREPKSTPAEPLAGRTSSMRRFGAVLQRLRGLPLSNVQAVIGTFAGIVSITGALFSLVQFLRPANMGELVAVVQESGSHRAIRDAAIAVLTKDDAIIATLTPDADGRATQTLERGTYVVRVSCPGYASDVRRIQVVPHQKVEIRATLHAGSSLPVDRAVSDGVRSVWRALHF